MSSFKGGVKSSENFDEKRQFITKHSVSLRVKTELKMVGTTT